jgi:hypothetical protein
MTKPKHEPLSALQKTAEPPEFKGLRYKPAGDDVAPELKGLRYSKVEEEPVDRATKLGTSKLAKRKPS